MKRNLTIQTTSETKVLDTLKVLNGILGLTDNELKVVGHFIALNPEFPCAAKDRKVIFQKMGLKNVQALNNVIRAIVQKKVFIQTGNGYAYCPVIRDIQKLTEIKISLV